MSFHKNPDTGLNSVHYTGINYSYCISILIDVFYMILWVFFGGKNWRLLQVLLNYSEQWLDFFSLFLDSNQSIRYLWDSHATIIFKYITSIQRFFVIRVIVIIIESYGVLCTIEETFTTVVQKWAPVFIIIMIYIPSLFYVLNYKKT